MAIEIHNVDVYYFEKQFQLFKRFIEKKGQPLGTFGTNDYLLIEEGYKTQVHGQARSALNLSGWQQKDIGTGKIAKAVINAVELENNNLVTKDLRYGPKGKSLYRLHRAFEDSAQLVSFERVLYELFFSESDQVAFSSIVSLFGKRYPLVAYLFFLKDKTRYMPVAPMTFDRAFEKLGVKFTTSRRCSWNNYMTYLSLLTEVKLLLLERLEGEVALLDAHSFAYILAKQMSREAVEETSEAFLHIQEYAALKPKERDAVVASRIGQGMFRQGVINYFGTCAVTGCVDLTLLIASHMLPWKECSPIQARDHYNGLLLSPNLDALFDKGLISFSDYGEIMISPKLSPTDTKALAIDNAMKITKPLDPRHLAYLQHHRQNVFQAN